MPLLETSISMLTDPLSTPFWHDGCIALIPTAPTFRSRSESAHDAMGAITMTESPAPELASRLGATIQAEGVHFAVWAPAARTVEVEVHGEAGLTYHPLARAGHGVFEGLVPGLSAGSRYK